jgi:hypothetical protein
VLRDSWPELVESHESRSTNQPFGIVIFTEQPKSRTFEGFVLLLHQKQGHIRTVIDVPLSTDVTR